MEQVWCNRTSSWLKRLSSALSGFWLRQKNRLLQWSRLGRGGRVGGRRGWKRGKTVRASRKTPEREFAIARCYLLWIAARKIRPPRLGSIPLERRQLLSAVCSVWGSAPREDPVNSKGATPGGHCCRCTCMRKALLASLSVSRPCDAVGTTHPEKHDDGLLLTARASFFFLFFSFPLRHPWNIYHHNLSPPRSIIHLPRTPD